MDQTSPPPIVCELQVDHRQGHVALAGRIVSSISARGSYRLEIDKEGPSGRSKVSQGGSFEVEPGHPTRVGDATFDFPPRTRFIARLTLATGERLYSCDSHEESL